MRTIGPSFRVHRQSAGARPNARGAPRPPAAAPTPSPSSSTSSSLIPDTLRDLAADPDHQALIAAVSQPGGQVTLTAAERAARRRALDDLGVPPFAQFVGEKLGAPPSTILRRGATTTLQLNVGLYCNQACRHCHVESSPLRTAELMHDRTADRCLELAAECASLTTVDLTGGAPELCPAFRRLVTGARALGLAVIDRCNLTVLSEPGQERLGEFLAEHSVRVVASLPCYTPETVEAQRGRGVFQRSIDGLKALNALGYGMPGTGLVLDLVYNPGGAFLAPPQASLEPAYRAELGETYGISFSSLLALNNMPIKRFADDLSKKEGGLKGYMSLLVDGFNPGTVEGLMCRGTVSVAWDGSLYDCDFNQQLAIGLARGPATVFDLASLDELEGSPIAVGCHCFGCTAGSGSGCGGQA